MKFLLSTLLAALCFHAGAEIIVYKSSVTITTTGNGQVEKENVGGFSVVDTESGEVVDINARAVTKTFDVYYLEDHTISTVQAPMASYTIVALVNNTLTASALDLAKGKNGLLTFNGKKFGLPKAFTAESRGVFRLPDRFLEAKGKAVFDAKRTSMFDLAGKDLDEVVGALADELLGLGYTEDFSRPAPAGTTKRTITTVSKKTDALR